MNKKTSDSVKKSWGLRREGTINQHLISVLSNRNDWCSPKIINDNLTDSVYPPEHREMDEIQRPRPKAYSRSGIDKALDVLRDQGVVERRYLPPKSHQLRKKGDIWWHRLSEKEQAKHKNSEWRLTSTREGFKKQLQVMTDTKKSDLLDEFLKSPHYQNNKKHIFYLFNQSFYLGDTRPSIHKIRGISDKKGIYEMLEENERIFFERSIHSPTLWKFILQGQKSGKLANWFYDNISNNALDYMRFVAIACFVVDAHNTDDSFPVETVDDLFQKLYPSITGAKSRNRWLHIKGVPDLNSEEMRKELDNLNKTTRRKAGSIKKK